MLYAYSFAIVKLMHTYNVLNTLSTHQVHTRVHAIEDFLLIKNQTKTRETWIYRIVKYAQYTIYKYTAPSHIQPKIGLSQHEHFMIICNVMAK